MSKFIMLVGIPASGKSTFAQKLKEKEEDVKIVSSDSLRKEIFGDINHQGDNDKLFAKMNDLVREKLSKGKDVVLDSTNLYFKRRKHLLNYVYNNYYDEAICYYMNIPIEIAHKRNIKRNKKIKERQVPETLVKDMSEMVCIPQHFEGWDEINVINNFDLNKKFLKVDQKFFEEIIKKSKSNMLFTTLGKSYFDIFAKYNEEIKYKTLNLMKKVRDLTLNPQEKTKLLISALYYFSGKSLKEIDDSRKYVNFENLSAVITLNHLPFLDYDHEIILSIAKLIQYSKEFEYGYSIAAKDNLDVIFPRKEEYCLAKEFYHCLKQV